MAKKKKRGRPPLGKRSKNKITIAVDWDLDVILSMADNKSAVFNAALRYFQKQGMLRKYLEGKRNGSA